MKPTVWRKTPRRSGLHWKWSQGRKKPELVWIGEFKRFHRPTLQGRTPSQTLFFTTPSPNREGDLFTPVSLSPAGPNPWKK
jgi:hypothetical protein